MVHTLAILHDAYRQSGYRLIILFVLLLLVGLTDGLSMALLFPVLDTLGLGSGTTGTQSTIETVFRSLFAFFGVAPTLWGASSVLMGAVFVQTVVFTAQNWLLYDIQKRYVAGWQEQLFADYLDARWSYLAGRKAGEILNLIVTEAPRVGAALYYILQLTVTGMILLVYIGVSLAFSWKLTLFLLITGSLLFAALRPINSATRRYGAEFEHISGEISSSVTEFFAGAKFVKASASSSKAKAIVTDQIERLRYNLTWSAFLPTTVRSVFEFVGMLIILFALIYGLKVDRISSAQVLIVIGLVARLYPRLMHLQQFRGMLLLSAPAYDVLSAARGAFRTNRELWNVAQCKRPPEGSFDVDAAGLSVRYGEHLALDRVDFALKRGEMVGFVGPSGSGKSTIVDVLTGLIEPNSGRVSANGVPLNEFDMTAWRRKIGYVSQETFLFHDTILNNIRWTDPDVSEDAVVNAAIAAGAHDFILSLPDGYGTIVGDRGAKLSGGQRQRINIARALVRRPQLLILDEATSALDSLSERDVLDVIDGLKGKTTIVVVAHRFSAVRSADRIYVLENGVIVERGSWSELQRAGSLFSKMMLAQANMQ